MAAIGNGKEPFETLPRELSLHVLSHLDVNRRAQSCRVNKNWRQLASENRLWRDAFPGLAIPKEEQSAKRYIDRCSVGTRAEAAARLEKFIATMPMDGGGTFTCLFPFQKNQPIRAEMKFGVAPASSPRDELCIFMGDLPEDSSSDEEEPASPLCSENPSMFDDELVSLFSGTTASSLHLSEVAEDEFEVEAGEFVAHNPVTKDVLEVYGKPTVVPHGATHFMFYVSTNEPPSHRVLGFDNTPQRALTQVFVKDDALTAIDYLCKTVS